MLGAKGATQLPVSHNSYLGNSISKAAHILQSATAPELTLALPLSPAGQVQSACSHWFSRNPLALELSGSSESLSDQRHDRKLTACLKGHAIWDC